jgi:cytochrome b6
MGGLVFTSFIIQAATGVAMTFYYVPDVSRALLSVESLASSVTNGWIMRSMHRWTASLMVMFLVLHVFRVYLTGGFKKPREFTWLTGIVLAVITVSFGVTGYSLPFTIKLGIGPSASLLGSLMHYRSWDLSSSGYFVAALLSVKEL